MGKQNRLGRARTYVILRIRVRMVSLTTRKTFEMVLVVFFEGVAFRPTVISKQTLVLSFTMIQTIECVFDEE